MPWKPNQKILRAFFAGRLIVSCLSLGASKTPHNQQLTYFLWIIALSHLPLKCVVRNWTQEPLHTNIPFDSKKEVPI